MIDFRLSGDGEEVNYFVGCYDAHGVLSSLLQVKLGFAKVTCIGVTCKQVLGIADEVCSVFNGQEDCFRKDGSDLFSIIQGKFCAEFANP